MKTTLFFMIVVLMFSSPGKHENTPHARQRNASNKQTQVWKREEKTMNKNIHAMLENIAATNSGATLEKYFPVSYPDGYQYSLTENGSGNSTDNITTAAAMIENLKGTCGVWYDNGIFYIETSYHAATLESAMNAAKKARQLTIYDWKNDSYIPVK